MRKQSRIPLGVHTIFMYDQALRPIHPYLATRDLPIYSKRKSFVSERTKINFNEQLRNCFTKHGEKKTHLVFPSIKSILFTPDWTCLSISPCPKDGGAPCPRAAASAPAARHLTQNALLTRSRLRASSAQKSSATARRRSMRYKACNTSAQQTWGPRPAHGEPGKGEMGRVRANGLGEPTKE